LEFLAKKPAKKEKASSWTRKNNPLRNKSSPINQIHYLQRTIGNQAVQRLVKSRVIQAKPKVGKPSGKYQVDK
jgi:hypothetical protein